MDVAKTWRPYLKNARLRRVSAQDRSEGHAFRKTVTTIVQVEFRESLLSVRDEILQSLGHPVISAFGSRAARNLDLSNESVGVVLIGHGAPWEERCDLVAYFRKTLPGVPVVASLRQHVQQAYANGPNWGQQFTIDAWGNLTNVGAVARKTLPGGFNAAPATTKNQLTGYSYDAAGNLLTGSGLTEHR